MVGKQVEPPVIGYPSLGGNFLPKKTFLVTSMVRPPGRYISPPMSVIPFIEALVSAATLVGRSLGFKLV